jgi:hypothetical protein
MRKLFLLLALALSALIPGAQAQGPIVGPGGLIVCPKPAVFTGTAALAQVVAAVANQSIYICGWHITNSAASGTFLFAIGTGSNCGTGTITILPTQSITSNAPATDHIDYAFMQVPQGQALCINATATVSGAIWTNQF